MFIQFQIVDFDQSTTQTYLRYPFGYFSGWN